MRPCTGALISGAQQEVCAALRAGRPGRYTLQIAEFSGRSTLIEGRGQGVVIDQQFVGDQNLRKSPLATAAQDAEGLAEALAKDPEVRQMGYFPYTYHDRSSSRVTVTSDS